MAYFLESLSFLTGGALLARYFAAFPAPRFGKRFLAPICFGCAYILISYIAEYLLFSRFAAIPAITLLQTTLLMAATLSLSFAFFKMELGNRVFLLVSFFAIGDICSFIAVRVGSLVTDAAWQAYSGWLFENAATQEQLQRYLNVSAVVNSLFYTALYAALGFLTIGSIVRGFRHKNYKPKPAEILSLTLPCFSVFAISYAMRAILSGAYNGGDKIISGAPGTLVALSAVFLLLMMIASVRLFQKTIQLHIEERNTAVLREQVRQLQNQDSSGIYTQMRGLQHDMKNHLANIAVLVNSVVSGSHDTKSELENYLGKIGETLGMLDFAYPTGNSVMDAVIHQRYLESKRNNIVFSSDFAYPTRLGIDSFDLAVIIGNALDNAFEACANVPEPQRFVKVISRTKSGMFFIEVSNSYTGEVSFDNQTGLPISSKQDSAEHGLGLLNVSLFAEKYFGDIDIQLSKQDSVKVFRLTVMLQG